MIGLSTLEPFLPFMSIYKLKNMAPLIIVDSGLIGPKGILTIRLVLDTGASCTMINPDSLVHIGCKVTSSHKQKISTASGIEYVPLTTLLELKALGHSVKNLDVYIHDLPPTIPAEGLLGLNFLKHFNVHLNFLNNHIKITKN